ncbi:RTC4-like domain-containing protein [Astrocystis sublimbata]|nr:RTC4-like domain-containing protein [Astrocystis sublimbata]
MAGGRASLFKRRLGLTSNYSGGPPLTRVNGKDIQPAKRQKVKASSTLKSGREDPLYDPITAPPESSSDEAEKTDGHDSDEDYNRNRTADIQSTAFDKTTSAATTTKNTRLSWPTTRGSRVDKVEIPTSNVDDDTVVSVKPRRSDGNRPAATSQLKRELGGPVKRKKKEVLTKYGQQQQKVKRQNASQSTPSSSSGDSAQSFTDKKPFHRVESISPSKSETPRKAFKFGGQGSDSDEPESSKPRFRNLPRHDSSPITSPRRRRMRQMSPLDEVANDAEPQRASAKAQGPRQGRQRGPKGRKPSPNSTVGEDHPKPVFKMPGLDDVDPFDDVGSLDATVAPGASQDTVWDPQEFQDDESAASGPTCPMCYQEVDRELLEKYSPDGKMSVKQQTAFCRLHKRRSAAKARMEKGYPRVDWGALEQRCSLHYRFLRNILEGTQASHYRELLRERVESGKNRTLLTNNDNLTPGYYGPRGLQVMTGYILGKFSDVIRRRAVEDKVISARTYTGYIQTVLVPELAVRLIMEDMSVNEGEARDVLEDSIEIGELLYEEGRDVVNLDEKGKNTL